jgi:hypothetical protein
VLPIPSSGKFSENIEEILHFTKYLQEEGIKPEK